MTQRSRLDSLFTNDDQCFEAVAAEVTAPLACYIVNDRCQRQWNLDPMARRHRISFPYLLEASIPTSPNPPTRRVPLTPPQIRRALNGQLDLELPGGPLIAYDDYAL